MVLVVAIQVIVSCNEPCFFCNSGEAGGSRKEVGGETEKLSTAQSKPTSQELVSPVILDHFQGTVLLIRPVPLLCLRFSLPS